MKTKNLILFENNVLILVHTINENCTPAMKKTTLGANGHLTSKKFTLRPLIYISCFGLFATFLFSSFLVKDDSSWMCENAKYTYQIVMKGRGYPNLPITLCDEILRKRKKCDRVIIKYSDYVSIEIFSQDEIATLNTNLREVRYE